MKRVFKGNINGKEYTDPTEFAKAFEAIQDTQSYTVSQEWKTVEDEEPCKVAESQDDTVDEQLLKQFEDCYNSSIGYLINKYDKDINSDFDNETLMSSVTIEHVKDYKNMCISRFEETLQKYQEIANKANSDELYAIRTKLFETISACSRVYNGLASKLYKMTNNIEDTIDSVHAIFSDIDAAIDGEPIVDRPDVFKQLNELKRSYMLLKLQLKLVKEAYECSVKMYYFPSNR